MQRLQWVVWRGFRVIGLRHATKCWSLSGICVEGLTLWASSSHTLHTPTLQNLFPAQSQPTRNANPYINTNPRRNFPERKPFEFTPIPMPYADLLLSLINNQMVVVNPGKVY